ncbi:uncharacterized protein F4812DRAFT_443469 [Daldinia caldariorum]|uniref:uncharacterized protein n=1 Tax=Daldinia caldariorum TaxID=326644 RepID=UPI00200827C1|nr:uncharacterized protein F4812DRAFT_443469 [Daldinia caldariorum]KAI1464126.1 hypothetical protein F4812DRAFT_443469 [Daldinia caldariorum]
MSAEQFSTLSPADQEAILNGPALTPPPGVFPNFVDPPNKTAMAFAAVTICLVVSTLAVIIRLYSRFICTRTPKFEDYLVVAAFGTYVGYIYVTYWLLDIIGFFVHQWDIRVKDMTTHLYIVHLGTNLYSATMIVMKASIPKEWCRIFSPHRSRPVFYWICHVIIVMNILFYSVAVVVENVSCFPHKRIWDQLVPGSQCLNINAILIAGATINIILDFVILVLPQRVIWGLQMSRNKKIGVSLVFTIGLFACASAVSRLAYTIKYYFAVDKAYWLGALSLWCIAEMTCMFLIFAGPAMPAAFKGSWILSVLFSTFRTLRGSTKKASNGSSEYKHHRSWQRSAHRKKQNTFKRYQKIGDISVPLTTISSLEPATMAGPELPEPSHPGAYEGPETGIMFTKEFSVRKEVVAGGDDTKDFKKPQHPWEPGPHAL